MSAWARATAASLLLASAALPFGAGVAHAARHGVGGVRADSLLVEGRPIRRLDIVTRDIFEPLPEGRLRPLYRLGNLLHVRTRPVTVRRLLLFDRGNPWHAATGPRP